MSGHTDAIPLYKYSDLPSARSIRLIELQTGGDGIWSDITIKLTVHDIDTAPDFDALSYTWGLSIPLYSARANSTWGMDDVRRYPVEVDGSPLMVTGNLVDALRMLSDSYIRRNARKSGYLWIDSICIDQGNLIERGAQVALMGSIYETATSVICWLGQEDEFTDDALKAINVLARLPRERHTQVTFADWYNQGPALMRLGIFEELTPHMWCGLVAFLNRPWFSRVWIVQEVILAKSAMLVCGRRILPWSQLSDTISFLTTSGWHDHISSDNMCTTALLARSPGVYHRYLHSHVGVGMAAIYLESTRAGIASHGHKVLFRHLLHVHRFCDASDPRDKIYALLGIAWRQRPPFDSFPDAIVPDYQVSVRELYTHVARTMLRAYKDLRFLAHVQDATWKKTADLPSWVPDYTVDLKPVPLSERGHQSWKACGDLTWEDTDVDCDSGTISDVVKKSQLRVTGIYLDTIIDVVDERPSHQDFRESDESDLLWISLWTLAKGLKDTYPVASTSINPGSRFEVLWRTLISDTYNRLHPAPDSIGLHVFSYFVRAFIRIFAWEGMQPTDQASTSLMPDRFPMHISGNTDHNAANSSRFQRMTSAFRALISLEPPTSPFTLVAFGRIFSDSIEQELGVSASWDPLTQRYQSIPGQPQTASLTGYRNTFSDFERELRYTWNSRTPFRTAKGYLGMGAQSLRRGDEVWILGGANTPVILRKAVEGVQMSEDAGEKVKLDERSGPGNPDENAKSDQEGKPSVDVVNERESTVSGVVKGGQGGLFATQDANQAHNATEQEEPGHDAGQAEGAEKEEWEEWTDEEADDTGEGPARDAAGVQTTASVLASALPELKTTTPNDQEKIKKPEVEHEEDAQAETRSPTSSSDLSSAASVPRQIPTEPAATTRSGSTGRDFVPLNLPPGVQRLLDRLLSSQPWELSKTHTPAAKYTLVGETYVHGVMHGEAVQGIRQDSDDVVAIVLE